MAVEKIVSDDTKKNAIDLMVMMVVDEVAENIHMKPTELLPQFVASEKLLRKVEIC